MPAGWDGMVVIYRVICHGQLVQASRFGLVLAMELAMSAEGISWRIRLDGGHAVRCRVQFGRSSQPSEVVSEVIEWAFPEYDGDLAVSVGMVWRTAACGCY